MTVHELRDAVSEAFLDGKYAQAAGLLEELANLEPGEPRHVLRRGDCLRKAGRPAEALECYRRAARSYAQTERWLQAISVCKVILEIDPEDADTHSMLVEANTYRFTKSRPASDGRSAPSLNAAEASPAEALGFDTTSGHPPGMGMSVELDDGRSVGATAAPSLPTTADPSPAAQPAVAIDETPRSVAAERPETALAKVLAGSLQQGAPAEADLAENGEQDLAAALLTPLPDFDQRRIPLLSGLPQEAFSELLRQAALRQVRAGDVILQEGDPGSSLCILVSGAAKVMKRTPTGPVELARLDTGSFFGEMAMLSGERRAASVVATEECDILEVPQGALEQLAAAFPSVGASITRFYRDRLMNRTSLMSPLFRSLPKEERQKLAAHFALEEAAAGQVLIQEGQPGGALYVVVTGAATVSRIDAYGRARPVNLLLEGDVFGEISLLSGQPATATVTAKRRMLLLVLPRHAFRYVVDAFPDALHAALALWREREGMDRRQADRDEQVARLRRLAQGEEGP